MRGSGGGASWTRPAAGISLGEVVHAMVGGISLNHCLSDRRVCPPVACPVQSVRVGTTQVLDGYLASVRFDALALRNAWHRPAHLRVQATGRVRGANRCAAKAIAG